MDPVDVKVVANGEKVGEDGDEEEEGVEDQGQGTTLVAKQVLDRPWTSFRTYLSRNVVFFRTYIYLAIFTGFPFNLVFKDFNYRCLFVWCLAMLFLPIACYFFQMIYIIELFSNKDLLRMVRKMYLLVVYFLLQICTGLSLSWILFNLSKFEKMITGIFSDNVLDLIDQSDSRPSSALHSMYKLAFCQFMPKLERNVYSHLLKQRLLFFVAMPLFFFNLFFLTINTFELTYWMWVIGVLHTISGVTLAHSLVAKNAFCIFLKYKLMHFNLFIQLIEKDNKKILDQFLYNNPEGKGRKFLTFFRFKTCTQQASIKKDREFLGAIAEQVKTGLPLGSALDGNLLKFVRNWYKTHLKQVDEVSKCFSVAFTLVFIALVVGVIVMIDFIMNASKQLMAGRRLVDGLFFDEQQFKWTIVILISVALSIVLVTLCLFSLMKDAADVTEEAAKSSLLLWQASERMASNNGDLTDQIVKMSSGTMSIKPAIHLFGAIPLTRAFAISILTFMVTFPVTINRITGSIHDSMWSEPVLGKEWENDEV